MIKHNISKFSCEGNKMVSSWLQFNIAGKTKCFSVKTVRV